MITTSNFEECRKALEFEKAQSLQQTDNWKHVDRNKVHAEWAELYVQMAKAITDDISPVSNQFQTLVQRHYEIIKVFYVPSKQAYIGMSLYYVENDDFKKYHDGFHPLLAEHLQKGMQHFASLNM